MDPLQEIHNEIDSSDWNSRDQSHFNKRFQEINERLQENHLQDLLRKSEMERQVFSFNKGPEGLRPMTGGTKTLADGSEIPFEWPDIKDFTDKDFKYISQRFDECKSVFPRTEYGLFLFYSNQRRDNHFAIKLLKDLLSLAKIYLEKSKPKEEKNHYIHDFKRVIDNAIFIAENRKADDEISKLYKSIIKWIFEIHQQWDITHQSTLRTILDFTNYAIEYFKDFSTEVDVLKFFTKNWEAAQYLSNTYVWGAIYTADISIKLCEKTKTDKKPWLIFKAQQYEKLAKEAERTPRQFAAISFVEKALRLYLELKDEENIARLEKKYSEIRGSGEFMEFTQPFPEEVVGRIEERIKKEISEKDPKQLLMNFVLCPMYESIDTINKTVQEKKKEPFISYYFGTTISDKFGNTIEIYPGQSEEWAFIQSYGFQFQIGTHFLARFFFEAFNAGKLTDEVVLDYLKGTWYNDPIKRIFNSLELSIVPLDIIRPCIVSLFEKLRLITKNPSTPVEFLTIVDSMVLKVEAITRYLCEKIDIPTFKPRKGNIVMEKNLEDLLADLKHDPNREPPQITNFNEEDRWFIKYIMMEKAGENLRNRVAHGLLDLDEYSFEKVLLPFTILMRLSNYRFDQNPQ
jgi:hypothetical protein